MSQKKSYASPKIKKKNNTMKNKETSPAQQVDLL